MSLDDVLSGFSERMISDRVRYGRVPLFVLGAGVSSGQVPFLGELATWLWQELRKSELPEKYRWVADHARAISDGYAVRRQTSEFFSVLQREEQPFLEVWKSFSQRLLGMLAAAQTTVAHELVGQLLWARRAYVISLNFDGLTLKALRQRGPDAQQRSGILLHSESDVLNYFSAASREFVPAVIKARGDIFYSKCLKPSCPQYHREHPLDPILERLRADEKARSNVRDGGGGSIVSEMSPLGCSICGRESLRLQFRFPGYSEKEEAANPILFSARGFLASRISAIVMLGLSGRWDRHLLEFVCELARERSLVFADVKPSNQPPERSEFFISSFVRSYYPSLAPVGRLDFEQDGPLFARIEDTAEHFLTRFVTEFD